MNADSSESGPKPRLKDADILEPFMDYLEPACLNLMPGESLTVYRTQNIVPVDEYGESPRPRRQMGKQALSRKLTKEEVDSLSPAKRNKLMGEWGLSCNDSEESATANFLFTYQKLVQRGVSPSELDSFAEERGTRICRYRITSESGLITPFDNHGHANLYLYEGVSLESLRDKEYNFKTIEYRKDED